MDARDQAGGRETVEGGVVLRFPGGWVGPLEELVPFGPSADREASDGAADFWGEDSAVLQDAVEAEEKPQASVKPPVPEERLAPVPRPPQPRPSEPMRRTRWLLSAGAVLAVALFVVAAVLHQTTSSAPQAHGVTFSVASIPPLSSTSAAVKKQPTRHRTATRPRTHTRPTRSAAVSTHANPLSSPVTTPAPTYHPPAASSSSGSSSGADTAGSQSGGAFTLGGP